MNSTAIVSLFTALTPRLHSHNAGFIQILLAQLAAAGQRADVQWSSEHQDWNRYSELAIWQGLDMNGKLAMNLFGGSTEANLQKLERLANFPGRVRGIIYPVLPYHELKDRKWPRKSSCWEKLRTAVELQLSPVANPDPVASHLYLGDSHVLSVFRMDPSSDLVVWSGQTLFKLMARDQLSLISLPQYRKVTLYFGQIDLRHHLCRQADPLLAAEHLATQYAQLVRKNLPSPRRFEICALHPIETEERKIPTTGHYKGTPFYGSWAAREACRNAFNETLVLNAADAGYHVVFYPLEWHNEDGSMNQAFMERPRSIHVAPAHYALFQAP